MVKDVILRYLRDDGQEFVADWKDFFVTSDGIEGIDFADWSLYSEKLAFKDGSVITGESYSGRTITAHMFAHSDEKSVREYVRKFFNPRNKYKLFVTYKDIERWIDCRLDDLNLPTKGNYIYTPFDVSVFCENPMFNGSDSFVNDLSAITKRWGFPYIATERYTPIFSVFSYGEYVWFDNEGEEDTTFKAKFTFDSVVSEPVITQGYNDAHFKLTGTFIKGDVVEIDFATKKIELNGVNIYNRLTFDSKPLIIPKGGTYISIGATTGGTYLHCNIEYYPKYGGI